MILSWLVLILLAFVLICTWIFLLFYAYSMIKGAPFVPSADKRMGAIMDFANLKPGMRVADLGSGDGKLILAAARRGATVEGWEVNPILAKWSRLRIKKAGFGSRASVHRENLWDAPLGQFDVVFAYLMPELMARLKEKVQRECRPGTTIILNGFVFPDWTPDSVRDHVRLYRVATKQ